MRLSPILALACALASLPAVSGCSQHPPAQWAQGGAQLGIGRARWERGADTVDLTEDGRVLIDGDHVWTIDAAGRVMDPDKESVALLLPDGRLLGNGDEPLGVVGMANASPPGNTSAWATLAPTGQVVLYDSEGERRAGGGWGGCQGPVFRTCTLITHLVVFREMQRRPSVGFGLGVGVGIHR